MPPISHIIETISKLLGNFFFFSSGDLPAKILCGVVDDATVL